jgi:hypothetical protein
MLYAGHTASHLDIHPLKAQESSYLALHLLLRFAILLLVAPLSRLSVQP